jgi:diguanylate cyclase (GGDEF)-like protein/PAS domain S-box-containing protein
VRIDITELKQREVSFRLLFEANPVPMWLYDQANLHYLAVNDAAVAHYGYSREQFLAMTLLDIRPTEDHDPIRRNARAGRDIHDTGHTWRHLKADGTLIDVAIYRRSLRYHGHDASLVAAIDLTERKHVEDELRSTRAFLDTVVENMPEAILVKDVRDLRYILINRAAEVFFGRKRDEIVGKTAEDLFDKDAAQAITARDRKVVESGEELLYAGRPLHLPDGERLITNRRLIVRGADGEPQYLLGIIEDITERKRAEARIAHMAQHDTLTDLPNRIAFNERFRATLDRAAAAGERFAVMCIDLDRFKEVNDVFGHAVGDAVLCEAARRLQAAAGGAFLARLGGDEFTLIATEGGEPEAAERLAERLLAAMADEFHVHGHDTLMGMSVGVAIYPADGADTSTLLANADAALYRAKAEGRGSLRFFEPDMDTRLRERRALQHDLQSAIEAGEMILHYQPQARIDGTVIGFEALVRWQHPSLGTISPGTFIPLAEETGLIIPIGEWILREACREAASWPHPLQIAINLSPVQFRHGDLAGFVHTVLLETGLAASRLELEITEGVLIGDFSRAVAILRRLKGLGVRIAMDDFGTGYSSLSYLQSFPFDKIKIDQAFISNLERNPQSVAIVRAVIGLGRGLDLPVVAEGVETEDQLAFLTREACNEIQGYLIGRPLPIEEYAKLVGRPAPRRKTPRKIARTA